MLSKELRPCALCGQVDANRPALKTSASVFPFPEADPLSRYCDARLHVDCLADWPHRRRLSQGYVEVERLNAEVRFGLVLAESEEWLLKCSEVDRSGDPTSVIIALKDWPVRLWALRRRWPEAIIQRPRERLAGAARAAAERVVSKVLHIAPDEPALRELRQRALAQRTAPRPPAKDWDVPTWTRGMQPLPPVSDCERCELEQLGAALHARGWASHVTVANLIRSWLRFAMSVERSRYLPEEFANELGGRDALEEVLSECPAPLVDRLRAVVGPADDAYRAATREDGGRSLRRFFRGVGGAWWWLRRPVRGVLSDALDARDAGPA